MTYEAILERVLARVPSTFDKREGSVIFDAIAPVCAELAQMYIELEWYLTQSFADTADREYLIRRCAERGVFPKEATRATLKATIKPSTLELDFGTRFSCNNLNYSITTKIADGSYNIVCETAGTAGNVNFGTLIPIEYVAGLESATLDEVVIPASDEETTETLRTRYLESFEIRAFGGNCKDYIETTNALDGVGGTKVTPCHQGGGTVKVTIVSSDYGEATATLVDSVQQSLDPTRDGTGQGLAPIGHIVTVESAAASKVNITLNLTFRDGYSWASQKTAITSKIEEYLLELRTNWSKESTTIVRIAQIEARLLMLDSVMDTRDTLINGAASNLELASEQIPTLGDITHV